MPPKIIFLLISGLVFVQSALASASGKNLHRPKNILAKKVKCESLESLTDRIGFCTDNILAVQSAEDCTGAVLKKWKKSDLRVNVSLRKKIDGSQVEDFHQVQKKLAKSIRRQNALIYLTMEKADLLATYKKALMNDPLATTLDGSPECFTEARSKISKIVSDLDKKVGEGIIARDESVRMKNLAAASERELHNDSSEGKMQLVKNRAPASEQSKITSRNASDITGDLSKKTVRNTRKYDGQDIVPEMDKGFLDKPHFP